MGDGKINYGHDPEIFHGGEVLADIAGSGAAVDAVFAGGHCFLVWVRARGGSARVQPFLDQASNPPTATFGIFCPEDEPVPLTLHLDRLKVFAAAGVTVHVWGYRY